MSTLCSTTPHASFSNASRTMACSASASILLHLPISFHISLTFISSPLQLRGQKTEAQESVTAFLKRRPADAPSVAVAVTNLIALRGPKDVADGLKRLEKIVVPVGGGGEGKVGEMGGKGGGGGGLSVGGGEGGVTELRFEDNLEVKLSRRQKAAVLQNRFLLLLLANRVDEVRRGLLPAS